MKKDKIITILVFVAFCLMVVIATRIDIYSANQKHRSAVKQMTHLKIPK